MANKKLKLSELNRDEVLAYVNKDKISIVIVLDNIRSAQNIGSIFRTCDAFNIECIYITGISAIPPNKEILKTALGSTESVKWEYCESAISCVEKLKKEGYTIIGIEQTQQSLLLNEFSPTKDKKYVLVLGNEVEGVSQAVINKADITLEIPQFGTKHSLNVSVCAGIVIWDVYQKLYL
jgi:23S rRNA (guanosine2251-2'-O)-methyltransferase